MKSIVIFIILLLLVIGGLVFVYIYMYNKLKNDLVRIMEAESEIDTALRKKYDILVEMENIINKYTELDQDNFKDISKDTKISNFDFDRLLTKVTNNFQKIRLDYQDKLDIKEFRSLSTELKITEEKNDAAKSYYNKYTTKLNELTSKFPSNIIGKIHGINAHLYFDNKNMVDDDILDFKL